MRIAFVNHRDWLDGGMDKVVLVQREELLRRGHEAVIFAQSHERNLDSPYRHYFPKDVDRQRYSLSLKRLPLVFRDVAQSIYNPQVGKQFGAFLDDFRPDVVHVHGLMRSFSPAIYDAAQRRQIPLIQTHHYVKLACPTGKLLQGEASYCERMPCLYGQPWKCVQHRCQENSVARSIVSTLEWSLNHRRYRTQPDLHLAPSGYLRNLLLSSGVAPHTLQLHPNFVDTTRFTPALTKPEGGRTFLYAGRISPEKGITTFLQAVAPLKDIRVLIAGEGPMYPFLRRQTERNGLSHITWLGALSEAELVPYLQQARAVVMPSRWGEIFGLSILEAFACGTMVIGSDVGAIPELVIPGETGFLVPPGNHEALRHAIGYVANMSASEANAIGERAARWVKRTFDLERHMELLLGFYQQEGVLVS